MTQLHTTSLHSRNREKTGTSQGLWVVWVDDPVDEEVHFWIFSKRSVALGIQFLPKRVFPIQLTAKKLLNKSYNTLTKCKNNSLIHRRSFHPSSQTIP